MVLKLYCSYLRPEPKEKFMVIGCIEPKPVFLFIDTDVNPFINIYTAVR